MYQIPTALAALDDVNAAKILREKLIAHHIPTEVLAGRRAICELAAHPVPIR